MEQNNTIGTLLKKCREENNISIEDIAQKTKININILKALEEDDLHNLPNKTYVRGFVSNYAKTVGLDVNDARNSLENTYNIKFGHLVDETSPQKTLGALQADNPEEDETEEIKETLISIVQGFLNKKVIYACVALLILFVIGKGIVGFLSQLTSEQQNISETSTTSVKSNDHMLKDKDANILEMDASKKLASEIIAEKKEAEKVTEEKRVEEKEAVKKVEVKKKEVVKLPASKPVAKVEEKTVEKETPKVAVEEKKEAKPEVKEAPKKVKLINGKFPFKNFYPAPTEMYSIVKDAPEANNPALLPPNIKASLLSDKQNVYVVATEQDTWISYKSDESKIKRFVLKKGRRILIKGDRVLLFMGNFNAAKIFLNNELISAQTKTGVKSMIFPEDAATDFELPLFPSYKGIPYSAEDYKANMATQEETSI
jgi:cytoskeleton protein RodZ